ncbi:hypothetical protein EUGRSUZ_G02160 [Eucalyptus grandis]|uniref:Uncharacterized protein n=2 Tax=Eucalyptus grandis TaxID=71139 RepID=A0ACC3K4U8_EUCGR|nr:hypothetical protein EUGRSUZ_G02160 [Eucalyptus grandis]
MDICSSIAYFPLKNLEKRKWLFKVWKILKNNFMILRDCFYLFRNFFPIFCIKLKNINITRKSHYRTVIYKLVGIGT